MPPIGVLVLAADRIGRRVASSRGGGGGTCHGHPRSPMATKEGRATAPPKKAKMCVSPPLPAFLLLWLEGEDPGCLVIEPSPLRPVPSPTHPTHSGKDIPAPRPSIYRGVFWNPTAGRWRACISVGNLSRSLGYYHTDEEGAGRARARHRTTPACCVCVCREGNPPTRPLTLIFPSIHTPVHHTQRRRPTTARRRNST